MREFGERNGNDERNENEAKIITLDFSFCWFLENNYFFSIPFSFFYPFFYFFGGGESDDMTEPTKKTHYTH